MDVAGTTCERHAEHAVNTPEFSMSNTYDLRVFHQCYSQPFVVVRKDTHQR